MAFTATPLPAYTLLTQPQTPGNQRVWTGTVTVDGTYVSGTGFTVPATLFGMTRIDFAIPQIETTLLNFPTYVSGGANVVFKVVVGSTATQLASSAGSGLIFPMMVIGV